MRRPSVARRVVRGDGDRGVDSLDGRRNPLILSPSELARAETGDDDGGAAAAPTNTPEGPRVPLGNVEAGVSPSPSAPSPTARAVRVRLLASVPRPCGCLLVGGAIVTAVTIISVGFERGVGILRAWAGPRK